MYSNINAGEICLANMGGMGGGGRRDMYTRENVVQNSTLIGCNAHSSYAEGDQKMYV